MFTPQRKGWAAWSLSPARAAAGEGSAPPSRRTSVLGKEKGKGILGAEALPPPPQGSLGEVRGDLGEGGEDVEAWRRFREAGLLDESALQRKDREALLERLAELERELHEYQYNMGLLLIEKKEWTCKYEEIRTRLAETEEILKREQTSHLIAISEVEKREENLRNALGVEKQCVADLENALREMRAQMAEVKFTSDRTLAEAHALEASLEEKSLVIEQKLHSADAKLAEASRKSSEAERKLEDVEARERKIQRELMSLNNERNAHEKDLARQREHLRDWEKSLQDRQKRLVDEQSALNEREFRVNETDKTIRKKEEELEEARRRIECSSKSLEEKDDDIVLRLRALTAKEKEANAKQVILEQKERDLLAIEEKLNARERVEMQKLIDEHTSLLDSKRKEFELELGSRRRTFEDEVKAKLEELQKKEEGINDKGAQVLHREQALESKRIFLKDEEHELEVKLNSVKGMEKSLKSEDKKLDEERKKLQKETQALVASKTELERLKATIEAEKQQINQDRESLKLTKEERDQYVQLQLKLKEEIEDCRLMKESLAKQIEDLTLERERFESEWEVLDEKRSALNSELKQVSDERERFEKWRRNEEERLGKERLDAKADIDKALAELNLKKESFQALKMHELSMDREELDRERADIAAELERLKYELDLKMKKKEEEMEKRLLEKEMEFIKSGDVELTNVRVSSNLIESRSRKLQAEQDRLEREKEQLSVHRKRLEADQQEIQKDIDTLRALSRNLKATREEFIKERDYFFAVAEKCKVCKNCGIAINELELLGLQPSSAVEDMENVLLPSFTEAFMEDHMKGKISEATTRMTGSQPGASGGRMSWLKKCSKIFNFSPGKKSEDSEPRPEPMDGQAMLSGRQLDRETSDIEANDEASPSAGLANGSIDTQRGAQSDSVHREIDEQVRCDKGGDEPEPSFCMADNSIGIRKVLPDIGIQEGDDEPIVPSNDKQSEREASLLPNENDALSEQSKQRRRRRGRPRTIKRTRSVKAVVEDAKAILGETSEKFENLNGDIFVCANSLEESQGDSVHGSHVPTSSRHQKHTADASRATSDLDAEDSEVRSSSMSLGGGHRKRRQTSAPETQAPAKRYNFRRSTIASAIATAQALSDQSKGCRTGHQLSAENETVKSDVREETEGTSDFAPKGAPSLSLDGDSEKIPYRLQRTAVMGTVVEARISSQRIVQTRREDVQVETDDCIVADSVEFGDQSGDGGADINATEIEAALPSTPSDGGSSSDDDGSEEDDEKHNASVGKKLWNFFTT